VFLYHPFILNPSATTIALWVRYAVKGAKGNFFRGYLYPYVDPKCRRISDKVTETLALHVDGLWLV